MHHSNALLVALRRPFVFSLLAAAFFWPCAGFAATPKPYPQGIYDVLTGAPVTGKIDLTNNPLLDNPNVDGYRYRTGWGKIQPDNADTYNWDSIDSAIAIAAAHGKKICISIGAGFGTPDWVYTTAPVVYKYHMLEVDPDTRVSIGDQPLPWDTAYQAKWATFVAAFAARYENNPALSYVVIGGFMQNFNTTIALTDPDFNAIEALAKNPPNGYSGLTTAYTDFTAAYVPAAEKVVTLFANSFPTTPILLTLFRVVPGDLGVTLQNVVPDWAKLTYPNHFGTMVSALYAVPPPHLPPTTLASFPKGFQMVSKASDVSRLYIDPDPVPLPVAPIPLQDALEHGVSLAGQYVEVYESDLTSALSQPVLAVERLKLKANVPPDGIPAAPTNLRIVP